jgi:hypothetical protein
MQQAPRQQVALGPERGEVVRRRLLRRFAPLDPQRDRILDLVRMAQRPRAVQGQARVRLERRGQHRHQRLGLRVVAFCREAGLGRFMVVGAEPRDLPGSGLIIAPGEVLEARPLIIRRGDAAPAALKGRFGARIVNGVDPGLNGQRIGLGRVAGIGQRLGATQHRACQSRRRLGALRQHSGVVRIGGDGFLPAAFQHRLRGPVRIALHESGDFLGRCRARRPQPHIQDQLLRHRIGESGRRGLGIRPAVGADGRQRIRSGILRAALRRQHKRQTGENQANRNGHDSF